MVISSRVDRVKSLQDLQDNFYKLRFGETFFLSFLKHVKKSSSITKFHNCDDNFLRTSAYNIPSVKLDNVLRFLQYVHDIFLFSGLLQSLFGLTNDSFECELLFGPEVFCEPNESKGTL
jgi:hypothetical protein